MTNINKLPQLSDNFDYLIDNDDYNTLHDNPSDYLIVYEYSHPILDITRELILNNIEFSHHICQLSDNSYLLININQFTNVN
jgi:hypothetical protein